MNAGSRLDALTQAHPEWAPWLSVLRTLCPELTDPRWEDAPALTPQPCDRAPLLAGALLQPDGHRLAQLLDRLRHVAHGQGLQALAGHATAAQGPTTVDTALRVFMAALNDEPATLDQQAAQLGASPEGFRALASLLPMPYLHAWARQGAARIGTGWTQGYCPVCGAWPAFAELRGIERARHLRCGRCAASWAMPVLACTYCATTDHQQLGSLVVEERMSTFAVEVCHACTGYLKRCTTLQATPADSVLAVDLASVAFDLAAVERGFRRPPGMGAALNASCATGHRAPSAFARSAAPEPPRGSPRT